VGPDVFVLDEPSSNLDAAGVDALRRILAALKEAGKTIVVSEHRLYYLAELADRYIILANGGVRGEYSGSEMRHLSGARLRELGLRGMSLREQDAWEQGEAPPGADASGVIIENLRCRYGAETVLNINRLSLPAGGIIAVVGHNGAGKSTLAGCLCGVIKCQGTVRAGGKALSARERLRKSYMVMQDVNHQLFTESVAEELGLNIPAERESLIPATLASLGLSGYRDTHPLALSGGEKQRVAIGSAVCAAKEILIYDEPTSGQDYLNMRATCGLIRDGAKTALITLVITHDPEFILGCCTGALRLSHGRVVEDYRLDESGRKRIIQYFSRWREEGKPLAEQTKQQAERQTEQTK
jgi:energy-coupling factor transport system ATP-binding protein